MSGLTPDKPRYSRCIGYIRADVTYLHRRYIKQKYSIYWFSAVNGRFGCRIIIRFTYSLHESDDLAL